MGAEGRPARRGGQRATREREPSEGGVLAGVIVIGLAALCVSALVSAASAGQRDGRRNAPSPDDMKRARRLVARRPRGMADDGGFDPG